MKLLKESDASSYIGLVAALVTVAWCCVLLKSFFFGNYWFTENGVLETIRQNNPAIREVVSSQRNIFRPSIVTVRSRDGNIFTFRVTSNIVCKYTIRKEA